MALPPWGARVLVTLGNATGIVERGSGSFGGYITTPYTNKNGAAQESFFGYQHWFSDYPDELIKKVGFGIPVSDAGTLRFSYTTRNSGNFKWPNNLVYDYYPDPPYNDPVPDPNGGTGDYTIPVFDYGASIIIYPRWTTDTAYDFFQDGIQPIPVPPENYAFRVSTSGGDPTGFPNGPYSWQLTKNNPQVKVQNLVTMNYEYYDTAQATTVMTGTAKIKLFFNSDKTCCWNTGYTIKGKLGIANAPLTAVVDGPGGNYSWGGITYTMGTPSTGTPVSFEIEVGATTPVEVNIPPVNGMLSFVNDYWIEEAIPPA